MINSNDLYVFNHQYVLYKRLQLYFIKNQNIGIQIQSRNYFHSNKYKCINENLNLF